MLHVCAAERTLFLYCELCACILHLYSWVFGSFTDLQELSTQPVRRGTLPVPELLLTPLYPGLHPPFSVVSLPAWLSHSECGWHVRGCRAPRVCLHPKGKAYCAWGKQTAASPQTSLEVQRGCPGWSRPPAWTGMPPSLLSQGHEAQCWGAFTGWANHSQPLS